MKILNEKCYNLLKKWEGCKLEAYKDTAGIWTIGYGSTYYEDGTKVKQGDVISNIEASYLFKKTITKYEKTVSDLVKVELTDEQFGALVSFCYNIGCNAFEKSTLLKKLNKGNYEQVPTELMRWIYSGKKITPGLVNRRSAESGLWASGSHVSSKHIKPRKFGIRSIKNPDELTPLAGLISGFGGMTYGSGPVQWAFAIIMIGSFLFVAYKIIKKHNEESK